jgi:hypothetical protein
MYAIWFSESGLHDRKRSPYQGKELGAKVLITDERIGP